MQPYLAYSSVAESLQLYCESAVLVCESISNISGESTQEQHQGLPQSCTQSTIFLVWSILPPCARK